MLHFAVCLTATYEGTLVPADPVYAYCSKCAREWPGAITHEVAPPKKSVFYSSMRSSAIAHTDLAGSEILNFLSSILRVAPCYGNATTTLWYESCSKGL